MPRCWGLHRRQVQSSNVKLEVSLRGRQVHLLGGIEVGGLQGQSAVRQAPEWQALAAAQACPRRCMSCLETAGLDEQLLNGQLELLDLAFQLAALIGGDRAGNDRSRHAAGTAQCCLGGHKHVRDIL